MRIDERIGEGIEGRVGERFEGERVEEVIRCLCACREEKGEMMCVRDGPNLVAWE